MAVYFWNAARSEPIELPWELQRFYCTAWQDRIISVLHPWVHPQLSEQCTEISVTTSVSPTTNRGCDTAKLPPGSPKEITPLPTKLFHLWGNCSVLGVRFHLVFLGGGYYVISCRIQVQLAVLCVHAASLECSWDRPTNAVKAWEKRCSGEEHVQKNKQEPVITHLQKQGQREVAVLRSFVGFQSRI